MRFAEIKEHTFMIDEQCTMTLVTAVINQRYRKMKYIGYSIDDIKQDIKNGGFQKNAN